MCVLSGCCCCCVSVLVFVVDSMLFPCCHMLSCSLVRVCFFFLSVFGFVFVRLRYVIFYVLMCCCRFSIVSMFLCPHVCVFVLFYVLNSAWSYVYVVVVFLFQMFFCSDVYVVFVFL